MIYLILAAMILILAPAVVLSHQARVRIRDYQRQLREAIEQAEQTHAELLLQSGLEQNIDLLRAKLYALGRPRRDGDDIYFGDTLITGQCAILDEVKTLCGGVAAVFSGDQRVATSVPNTDQSAGGARLAGGPVHDRVLAQGLSYHGESDVFGETYVTICEPILADGEVIGMICAGVKPAPPLARDAGPDEMAVSITALKAVLQAQADTLHRSLAARRDAQDSRRLREDQRPRLAEAA